MSNYNQNSIIDKLNLYLKLNDRSMKLKYGYCHGFSLFWLYNISIDNEKWFYNTIKKIAACETKTDFDSIQADIEKLLSHIEWLQNSSAYAEGVNQLDLDKILEIPRNLSLSYLFKPDQLKEILPLIIHANEMICLSGPTHTIGVFRRDNDIYIYDANYPEGEARKINDIESLQLEVVRCLFRISLGADELIPLEINILRNPTENKNVGKQYCDDKEKIILYKSLLNQTKDKNVLGPRKITNLFLACESGDDIEVKLLLKNGANPNVKSKNNWTPLMYAAKLGYAKITKRLLKYDADINFSDEKLITPIHLAAKKGHLDTVKVLMKHGANPLALTQRHQSAFYMAARNKHWDIIAYMLSFKISRVDELPAKDYKALRRHKNDILTAVKHLQETLPEDQKLYLSCAMHSINPPGVNSRFFSQKEQKCSSTTLELTTRHRSGTL